MMILKAADVADVLAALSVAVAVIVWLLSGNAVQVVAARYGALIPANLTQLLRKALFDAGEAPVRLEFSNFTVSEDGKGWRIEPPLRETPSQDDLNRWIDDWRQASALRVEPYAGDGAIDTMRVAFRSGKVLALDVIQKQPELILGRADQKLRYYFAAPVSARLGLEHAVAQVPRRSAKAAGFIKKRTAGRVG